MADARAKELIDLGDRLFAKKDPMNTLWQEIAEHFYVERADFTDEYIPGEDFARHLEDSYPALLRRELGNSISAMLRPRDRQWFKPSTLDDSRDEDPRNSHYLEYVVEKMRRLMYDNRTQLVRSTKQCDHDFVTFGQGVISCEESRDRDHLFYRSFHLRNCAWLESYHGEVNHLHRKDKMSARQMMEIWRDKVHQTVREAAKRDPGKEFQIRCVILPADEYDLISGKTAVIKGRKRKLEYAIVYIDVENCHILREGGLPDFPYIVPRWHTVAGSAYAYSPASAIALPDARMMQQMARIILEAGEKAVDPPVVAVEEAVREVNLAAGAITWADFSFDGKLREAVQPIAIENNMQVAFAMRQDMREMLQKAWFIDKLALPPVEGADQMTAREVTIRQSEFIRNLLPLFEPIEIEYNTKLLDKSFMLLRNMGHFPPEEVPDDLSGADIQWNFESPIQEGQARIKTSQFTEALELIMMSAQMGVETPPIDLNLALMDAIRGTSAPGDWFKDQDTIAEESAQQAEMKQLEQQMAVAQGALGLQEQMGNAQKAMGEGQAAMQGGGAPAADGVAPPPAMPQAAAGQPAVAPTQLPVQPPGGSPSYG